MKFKLVIVAGEGLRNEVELSPPVVIGRSRAADVTIGHPLVSRRHCEITQGDDDLLIVEDLGSLNGTYVGDVRIQEPVYLEPGDYLTVGAITFQALYGEHTEPDFPDDSNGEPTEAMPRLNAGSSKPAEEAAAADEPMFLADEPPVPDEEGDDLPVPEPEPPQAVSPSPVAEPVPEADEADSNPDGSQVFDEDAPSDTPSQGNDASLSWLTGSGKGQAGQQKAGGEDGLDDFFKKL